MTRRIRSTPVLDRLPANDIAVSYQGGGYITSIAKKNGVCAETIVSLLKKMGIYQKHRRVVPNCRYSFNEKVFDIIDTEDKAYWLGFLYADGYNMNRLPSKGKRGINLVGLTLAIRDEEHVKKFRSFLEYTGPLCYRRPKRGTRAVGVNINSRNFSDHLTRIGVMPNKTVYCKFPTNDIIPESMVRHFLRGYFDGDGCTAIRLDRQRRSRPQFEIRIAGTDDMMTGYAAIIRRELHIETYPIKVKGKQLNIRNVRFGGNLASYRFLDWLYQKSTIFMYRKHKRYRMLEKLNASPRKMRGSPLGYSEYYDNELNFRYV
jgi:hypothetical protein